MYYTQQEVRLRAYQDRTLCLEIVRYRFIEPHISVVVHLGGTLRFSRAYFASVLVLDIGAHCFVFAGRLDMFAFSVELCGCDDCLVQDSTMYWGISRFFNKQYHTGMG